MSEATAVADEVAPQLESTSSPPVSEASSAPPSIEESVAPGTGTEAPADEGEKLEPAPKPLEQWTLEELNEKASREGLNADELKRRDSIHQSVQQRQEWERQQLHEAEQRQQAYVAAMTKAYDDKAAHLLTQLDAFANGQDRELTAERMTRAIAELKGDATRIAEAPIHYDLDRLALSPTFFGDSVQNRRSLAAQTVNEKIDALIRRSFELGRNAGPDQDHVVLPKSQFEAEKQAAAKKAVDDYKAANPGSAPPSGGGQAVGGGKYYSQMSPEERQGLSPADRDRLTAVEAAARARGVI